MDRIGEVSDRASEEQAAGTCFTAGSLARVGVRDRTWSLRMILMKSLQRLRGWWHLIGGGGVDWRWWDQTRECGDSLCGKFGFGEEGVGSNG